MGLTSEAGSLMTAFCSALVTGFITINLRGSIVSTPLAQLADLAADLKISSAIRKLSGFIVDILHRLGDLGL